MEQKFIIKKSYDLSHLGSEWSGASVTFRALAYARAKSLQQETEGKTEAEAAELMLTVMREHFVEGKGPGGIVIDANDLELFPVNVVTEMASLFTNGVSPKAPATSPVSS